MTQLSEKGLLSTLKLSASRSEAVAIEQAAHEVVSTNHSPARYQGIHRHLREFAERCAHDFFDGSFPSFHLRLGAIHSHGFVSEAHHHTGHGAPHEIILDERYAFGTHRQVVNGWPAPGVVRFIEHGMLRGMVQLKVILDEGDQGSYGVYGKTFCEIANRIGLRMGWPLVVSRNRPGKEQQPLACRWPHNVCWEAEDSPYAPDVDWVPRWHGNSRERVDPFEGLMQLFLQIASGGNATHIEAAARNFLTRLHGTREMAHERVESGELDPEGNPMPDIHLNVDWLRHNDGCVAKLAQAIVQERQYDLMPILGDALMDADCDERALIQHCRLSTTHTSDCFVLRMILKAEEERRKRR